MDDFLSNELKKILNDFNNEKVVKEYNGNTYTIVKPDTLELLRLCDETSSSSGEPVLHLLVPYILENFIKEIDSGVDFVKANDFDTVVSLMEDFSELVEG